MLKVKQEKTFGFFSERLRQIIEHRAWCQEIVILDKLKLGRFSQSEFVYGMTTREQEHFSKDNCLTRIATLLA